MPRRLILIGGSARAAATSARAAAMAVAAIDLFGDQDLRAVVERWCRWEPAGHLIEPLGCLLASAPDVPTGIVLVGGAESAAETLDDARQRWESDRVRFLLPTAAQLRAAGDPQVLQAIADHSGIRFPSWRITAPPQSDRGQRWLIKPMVRCGGLAVRKYRGQQASEAASASKPASYLQRYVPGQLLGVSYCADRDTTRCLGVCLGHSGGSSAAPFRYAGSIGPLPISAAWQAILQRLGTVIRETLGLRGLFGVDLICDGSQVFLLEINARYCASMELLDVGTQNCLTLHCRAFSSLRLPLETTADECQRADASVRCKRIVYARRDLVWEPAKQQTLESFLVHHNADASYPLSAHDLPCVGTRVEAGSPLLTLIGRGDTARTAWRQVIRQSIKLRGVLKA